MATSEINYRDIVLYDKYIPGERGEVDCYRSALKKCSHLNFPLDFAKPERPGTKRRSKPSDLKRKPCPPPTPEPPEVIKLEEPPPEPSPPPEESFCAKICSMCCCCCASCWKEKEESTQPTVEEAEERAPPAEEPPPPVPLPPKPEKGILKSNTSLKERVPSTKSVAINVPEDSDNTPSVSSEMESEVVASFTATTTVVAVVSEPLTTIYRSEEISSIIETSTPQPASERSELSSDIQSDVEESSLPPTVPKPESHPPVLSQAGGPDEGARDQPGKEKEGGESIPTGTRAISLPEPTTGTMPSRPALEKAKPGLPGDQFTMEAASLPLVPSRSVPPRPHMASRRYFSLALPATSQQRKHDGKKSAPLPGRNWVSKFL